MTDSSIGPPTIFGDGMDSLRSEDTSPPIGTNRTGEHRGSAGSGLPDANEFVTPRRTAAHRILVVESDTPTRLPLVATLRHAGYDVCDVGSAREACKALTHDAIALVLSDLDMPAPMNVDLVRFARSERPQTAALLIGTAETAGIEQVGTDFGAYDYLRKPLRTSQVLDSVKTALWRLDLAAGERVMCESLADILEPRASVASDRLEESERRRVLQAEAVHRWAEAAEPCDPALHGHIGRMSRYAATLGAKLGLHAQSLELASMLHDVGKLTVPDEILLKPAFLTADDRRKVEAHAEAGYEMLRGSRSSVLDLAATIARTHHERFDGAGYPHGLSGTDIPLEGRIAAAADVFDALTYDRDYRPAWSVNTTISWMQSERAKHFDPRVLDAFIGSTDEILAIRAELSETSQRARSASFGLLGLTVSSP